MTKIIREYFPNSVSREFFNMFCGKRLGKGIGRQVFEYAMNPANFVVKMEVGGGSFQNIMEWELWNAVMYHPETAKWLAPVTAIGSAGAVMVQRRTTPLRSPSELPAKIPKWMHDTKITNWGLLDGRPVLHDYGFTKLLEAATRQNGRLQAFPAHQLEEGKALDHVSQTPEGRTPKEGLGKAASEPPRPILGEEPGGRDVPAAAHRSDAQGQPDRPVDDQRAGTAAPISADGFRGVQDRPHHAGDGEPPA